MTNTWKHFTLGLSAAALIAGATLPTFPPLLSAQETNGTAEAPATGVEEDRYKDASVMDLSIVALLGTEPEKRKALDKLIARGNPDIIPTLVFFMRLGGEHKAIAGALERLTGQKMTTWRDAMEWQEAHPEIVPHESYRQLKLRYLANIDQRFLHFFPEDTTSRDRLKIRLEEITWGGVRVDGIPPLDNPRHVSAEEAEYLVDDDLVFGIEINGDVRAYPLRIMGWHEMFNEVIGGVPVALAYCTLCGAGILFETDVEGRDRPFVFSSSGLLYRSNKLMYDRETNSLWNQFTGKPVGGPLVDSDIELKIRPVSITSWADWKRLHPDTKVLDVNTGFLRDYGSGVVYQEYFASPDLMFPTIVRNESQVKRKDYVFGIREFGAAKAWPLEAFRDRAIINDTIGATDVVLVGNVETRTVRAYQSRGMAFESTNDVNRLKGPGGEWTLTEGFLIGPSGEKLPRIPGHIAFWFAWDGYLGVTSELYSG